MPNRTRKPNASFEQERNGKFPATSTVPLSLARLRRTCAATCFSLLFPANLDYSNELVKVLGRFEMTLTRNMNKIAIVVAFAFLAGIVLGVF